MTPDSPEMMELNAAVKALAVLSAIPVVAFALWADYFGRYIDGLARRKPDFDRPSELQRVRLAGLCGILFQFMLFLGTGPIRHAYPLAANLFFIAAIVLQGGLQASVERKVRGRSAQAESRGPQQLELAARAFFWAVVGGVSYIAVLMLSVGAFTLVARAVRASPPVGSALVIVGAAVGVFGGLVLNFALGPLHLRKMLPTTALTEQKNAELFGMLRECFARSELPVPLFWIVEIEKFREANAMLAGFRGGRGVFRPALFISRCTLEALTTDELRAVVLHEAAHMRLEHLKRRFLLSTGMILGTTFLATFVFLLAQALLPESSGRSMIGTLAGVAAFVVTFRSLGRQSRLQEMEADIHCVEKMGAGLSHLSSALRKLDAVNDQDSARKNPLSVLAGLGHPATERRIRILEAYFARKRLREAAEGEGSDGSGPDREKAA